MTAALLGMLLLAVTTVALWLWSEIGDEARYRRFEPLDPSASTMRGVIPDGRRREHRGRAVTPRNVRPDHHAS